MLSVSGGGHSGGVKSYHKWDDLDSSDVPTWNGGSSSCMECHNPHYQGQDDAGDVMMQNRGQPITSETVSAVNGTPLELTERLCYDCHDSDAPVLVFDTGSIDLDTLMTADHDITDPTGNAQLAHIGLGGLFDNKCTVCHLHKLGFATCTGCHEFPPDLPPDGPLSKGQAHYVHVELYGFTCFSCHYDFLNPAANPEGHPSQTWKDTGNTNPFINFPPENARNSFSCDDAYLIEQVWFPGGTRINNDDGSTFLQNNPGTGNVTCNVGCHNPALLVDDRRVRASTAYTKNNNNSANWYESRIGTIFECVNCHDDVGAMLALGDSTGSKHPVASKRSDCEECHGALIYPSEKIDIGGGEYFYHTNYRESVAPDTVCSTFVDTTMVTDGWPAVTRIPLFYRDEAQLYFLPVTINSATTSDASYDGAAQDAYLVDDDKSDRPILEGYCLSCHNSSYYDCGLGATDRLFSGQLLAPNIKRWNLWENSAHESGGDVPAALTSFDGISCLGSPDVAYATGLVGCHGNPHGSAKKNLLGPPHETPGTANVNEEEGFCYKCHNNTNVANGLQNLSLSGMKSTTGMYPPGFYEYDDLQEAFNESSKHPVFDGAQGAATSCGGNSVAIECTDCHLVHWTSGKWKDTASGVSPLSLNSTIQAVSTCAGNDLLDVLWGDDPGEKAKDYAATFSGYGSEESLYQPDGYCCGGGMKDAEYFFPKAWWDETDQIPDTVTFCLECHTDCNKMRSNYIIGPGSSGCAQNSPGWCSSWASDMHGGGLAGNSSASHDTGKWWTPDPAPDPVYGWGCDRDAGNGHFIRNNIYGYVNQATRNKFVGINYVLMCTDCHDPHGGSGTSIFRDAANNAISSDGMPALNCNDNRDTWYGTNAPTWNNICNDCHYYYGGHHAGMACGNASCHERNSIHKIAKDGGSSALLNLVFDGSPCAFPPRDIVEPQSDGLMLHWSFEPPDNDAKIDNQAAGFDISSCTTCTTTLTSKGLTGHLTRAPLYNAPLDPDLVNYKPEVDCLSGQGDCLEFVPAMNQQGLAQLDFTADASDGYPEKFGILTELQHTTEMSVSFWVNPVAIACGDRQIRYDLNAKLRRDMVSTQFWVKNWGVAIMRFTDADEVTGNCTTEGADYDRIRFWVAAGDPNNMVPDYWCGYWPSVVLPADNTTYTQVNRQIWTCIGGVAANTGTTERAYSFAQTYTKAAVLRGDAGTTLCTPYLNADRTDPYATVPDGLGAGTWQHITCTFDGQYLKIYIDGMEAASTRLTQGGSVIVSDPLFWSGGPLNRHIAAYFGVGGRPKWKTNDTGWISGNGIADGIDYWDAYGDYDVEDWTSYVGQIDDVKYFQKAIGGYSNPDPLSPPIEIQCKGCHGEYPEMSSSHNAHFTSVYGPGMQVIENPPVECSSGGSGALINDCDACHGEETTYGPRRSASLGGSLCNNGVIDFVDGGTWLYAADIVDEDPAIGTFVCDTCHGMTYGDPTQTWRSEVRYNWNKDKEFWVNGLSSGNAAGATIYCGTCHGNLTALPEYVAGGLSVVNTAYGTGDGNEGSGVDAVAKDMMANFTLGHDGGAVGQVCKDCHDITSAHINQSPRDTYRMVVNPLDAPNLYDPEFDDQLCNVKCHNGSGNQAQGPAVSSHGNAYNPPSRPYIKQEQNFPALPSDPPPPPQSSVGMEIRCTRCHNVHGSSNLAQIRDTDFETPDGGTRSVVFTSLTGADSFDEVDTGIADASDSDDLCVVCHMYESPLGSGTYTEDMTHAGGLHAGYMVDQDLRGTDCTKCHKHNYDSISNTLDGFMPLLGSRCLDCHPEVDQQFDGLGTYTDNGLRSQHLIKYDDTDYSAVPLTNQDDLDRQVLSKSDIECMKCHGTKHPTPEARVVNVDMDTTYSSSNYGGRARDTLIEFCLSCHDGIAGSGDTMDIMFGGPGSSGVAGTIPVNQLPPRYGQGSPVVTGPWLPNPPDPDPLTGLPTPAEKYTMLFTQNGHGAENPLDPIRMQGPKYSCVGVEDDSGNLVIKGCHDYHGNPSYRLAKSFTNPFVPTDPPLKYDGETYNTYDDWCTLTCHDWIDPKIADHTTGGEKDPESGDSRPNPETDEFPFIIHATSMFIPLSDPLTSQNYKLTSTVKDSPYLGEYLSPPGLLNAGDVLCVTCHDPHGSNNVDEDMMRIMWINPPEGAPDLCAECHD
ncbi:LamG-like jellyroll fold domain-containing protein [Thermodesulfobacteriota bacterium]